MKNEIETVRKILQKEKLRVSDLYENTPVLLKLLHNINRHGILLNLSCKSNIASIQKPFMEAQK